MERPCLYCNPGNKSNNGPKKFDPFKKRIYLVKSGRCDRSVIYHKNVISVEESQEVPVL